MSEYLSLVETNNKDLKIMKMQLDMQEIRYLESAALLDPKFFLKANGDHREDALWGIRIESEELNYGIGYTQQLMTGGEVEIGLTERKSSWQDGTQSITDSSTELTLSINQPLLRDFIGLNSQKYSLASALLRYEMSLQQYLSKKQQLLFRAATNYLKYSHYARLNEVKKTSVGYLSNLVKDMEKYSPSGQLALDVTHLKIELNNKINEQHGIEIDLATAKYNLLTLIDSENSDFNFEFFKGNTDAYSDLSKDELAASYSEDNPALNQMELNIERSEIELEYQKNQNLPDLELNADLKYIEQENDISFDEPNYRVGMTFFMPIGDRNLALSERYRERAIEIQKLGLDQGKNILANQTAKLLEHLGIYSEREVELTELVSLQKKKLFTEINRLKSTLSKTPKDLDYYLSKTSPVRSALSAYEVSQVLQIRNIFDFYDVYYRLEYQQVPSR